MNIITAYDSLISAGKIKNDEEQRRLLPLLNSLIKRINQRSAKRIWNKKPLIPGIYLHGPVGSGKTFLMDLFFNSVRNPHKSRLHFHEFMQQIDLQLRSVQGKANPLAYIIKKQSKSLHLLCLDEFLVHDVGQAMILAELLQDLIAARITLVMTSNTAPDDLYAGGVQRQRFLPAIAMIKEHCQILALHPKQDYRLQQLPDLQSYFSPLTAANLQKFALLFAQFEESWEENGEIMVQARPIPFIRCGTKAIWFDFNIICNLGRSQLDYLELSSRFRTIFISNVPNLMNTSSVFALLFMLLIDILYDRKIRLILAAAIPLTDYDLTLLPSNFKRTLSRLQEMQSVHWGRL